MVRANCDIPEARMDTICPIQITRNAAIPAGWVFFGIEYPLYDYKAEIQNLSLQ
jgi:hypothetical protein